MCMNVLINGQYLKYFSNNSYVRVYNLCHPGAINASSRTCRFFKSCFKTDLLRSVFYCVSIILEILLSVCVISNH